jgi:hypothetical protein
MTCAMCKRRITRSCFLTATDVVVCARCHHKDRHAAHAVAYPDCDKKWHDLYDHEFIWCKPKELELIVHAGGYEEVRITR